MAEGCRTTSMPTASSAATDLMAVVVSEELHKKQASFDRYPLSEDGLVRSPPLAADMRELESCFGHRKLRQVFETVDANNKAYAELHEAYKTLQHKLAMMKMRSEIERRALVAQLASQAKKLAASEVAKEQLTALQSCTKCTRCSTSLPECRKGNGKVGKSKMTMLQLTQVELQERTALAMNLKSELHKCKVRCQSLEARNALLADQLAILVGSGSHGSVSVTPTKSLTGVTPGSSTTVGPPGCTLGGSPLLGTLAHPTPAPPSLLAHSAAVAGYFGSQQAAQTRSRDSVLYFKSDTSPMTLSTVSMPLVTSASVIKDTV